VKILFLCKRRPQGKDLVTTPYGRFFHLPRILAERGHEVSIALLDYRNSEEAEFDAHGIHWSSSPIRTYLATVERQTADLQVDWVVGFSDTYFGILAARLARKHGLRFCIDAYDNYESYMPWAKPLHWLWRRALRRADLITAAGPGLVSKMAGTESGKRVAVVPMAADPTGFEPRDRMACRRLLQLPTDRPLVGYCGSMHRSRGVDVLFDAIPLVLKGRPEVRFIHSGRTWSDVPLPKTITSLGFIDDDKVPVVLNSMDVLVVTNRVSSFGSHSYPVKLYEAMNCKVPVIATRTLATEWILGSHPECLVEPADAEGLSAAILRALSQPSADYQNVTSWDASCNIFERALLNKRL
jgi:glycosyltransferase involved in cell wall biosynthesis